MLINLVAIHPYPSPQSVPLANAFLKSIALNAAFDISLTNFFIGQNSAESAVILAAAAPRAIGFSMYLWNRAACLDIADEVRRILPSVLIFAGGPEVTADPGGVLRDGILDFVITGEGETPFAALCANLTAGKELSGIPGIILSGEAPHATPQPIVNLDMIPSPYLTGILDTRCYPGILWQLSRGCGFSCDFCFDSRDNHGVRRFSLERIEAELRHFAATGVSQIFVLDSTFNQDVKRAKSILRMIRKIAPNIHFHFEVRSEFIDREMANLFSRITCSLQIGLQSADPVVLKQVGRSFQQDDFTRRVGFLNESGAVFGFDLIYGLPGDTLKGFCSSMDYALSLYPNHLDIFPLSVLPGTRLASRAADYGMQWKMTPPYALLSSDSFDATDMATAAQLAGACDVFFTRGKAVAWFSAVMNVLTLKPSKFMLMFGEWLTASKGAEINEADFNDTDIWEMQRIFLQHLFSSKTLRRFLPLVLDLVDYHHHYAAALLAPPPSPVRVHTSKFKLSETQFCLSPSAQLARFHYEILDILDSGAPDIRWMYERLSAIGSYAVIYPNKGIVCTESLDESFFTLLEQMDGKPITEKLLHKTGITPDDTHDFLMFALQQGIILTV